MRRSRARRAATRTVLLATLDCERASWATAQGEGEVGSTPNKTFTIDDWQIEAFLFSGFDKDVIPKRAIATSMGDLRKISPAAEIREAAATKGSAYDPLDAPYLLVVGDCKEELPGGRHNGEALLEGGSGSRHALYRGEDLGDRRTDHN